MSLNIPCRIFRCWGCYKNIDLKKIKNPQRRHNIRAKVKAGRQIYCTPRCWYTR